MNKIPEKYFKGKRNKIAIILIDELIGWESTTKVSTEEFLKLVDKLYKVNIQNETNKNTKM